MYLKALMNSAHRCLVHIEFELSRTSSAHDRACSSVVFHNGIGVPIVGAPVPTVAGLAISLSAYHKARRLDVSGHQAEKRAHHVCIHGCVCGHICSLK